MKAPRRAVAGLALGAAGVLYSRLGGRRERREPDLEAPQAPRPEEHPHEASASPDELQRARSELSDELARRAGRGEA